jgi:hypothetical protein
MNYKFEIDRTGASDNIRAFLEYQQMRNEKYPGTDFRDLYGYITSWASKRNIKLPGYFNLEHLQQVLSAKGKLIPKFLYEWLASYYSSTPARMLQFTPEHEISEIVKDRQKVAAQAKATKEELLQMLNQLPDYKKMEFVQNCGFQLEACLCKIDNIKILESLVGNNCTVIDFSSRKEILCQRM